MRILISSDWQAEYNNLDQCKKSWKQVLDICKEKSLEAIVLAGDLKHNYNPVDLRVIKFWKRSISEAKDLDLRIVILLGNHDREGLYTDSKNWLSVLREFGTVTETFDKPGICQLTDGKIAMLPFTRKNSTLRERAKQLAEEKWDKNRDILLFHADVKECVYNKLGVSSQSKLKYEELYPEKYLACVGGHIHLPQEISKNGYYVGSPFSMDWGEANQGKRFITIVGNDIRSIESNVPGWYDETLPGFYKPKSWKESRIRIHTTIPTGKSFSKIIDRAQQIAEREYQGAIIKIVPEFENQVKQEAIISVNDTDERKIEQYVDQTIPDNLRKIKHKIIAFLIGKLRRSEGLRRHGSQNLKFIEAKGTNVLSFEKVKCSFEKQGLVLIEGENKDWSNQSNGSGKTNYSQLLPVSLFGTTFKGQKFDKWARRYTKDRAEIELKLTNESGQDIRIIRGRRPNWIQLIVNKVDHSSGLNKSKEEGTQQRIESITGFTWQILANSVYIDKTVANAFLSGGKSERTQLLYKFQNLERFERALKLIKFSDQKLNRTLEQTKIAIEHIEYQIKETKSWIRGDKIHVADDIKVKRQQYNKRLSHWKKLHSEKKRLEKKARHIYRKYKKKYNDLALMVTSKEKTLEAIKPIAWKCEQSIQKYENLLSTGKCPTCKEKVDRNKFKSKLIHLKSELKKVNRTISKVTKERYNYNKQCALAEGTIDKATMEESQARNKADQERSYLRSIKQDLDVDIKKKREEIKKLEKNYRNKKKEYKEWKKYKHHLISYEQRFIKYCLEAFSKDGIPAFINNQLCPVLNKASEYYSDLFTDKEIMVQFEVEDGNTVPVVTTLHGGDGSLDQSTGETSMAGLITSFALKEIAPKTNVLIIDEPEVGLSPENISRFARKLLEIRKRFETIMVVTHSPILLSELSNERVVRIVKKNRISKVVN
jgi:Icc-related predicted phosphoesterase